jgi:uncharacterized membrane protein
MGNNGDLRPWMGSPAREELVQITYNREKVHDRWRGVLTVWLLALFTLLLCFLLYAVLFRAAVLTADAKTMLGLVTSGLIGLIGTILGYFFASQRGG